MVSDPDYAIDGARVLLPTGTGVCVMSVALYWHLGANLIYLSIYIYVFQNINIVV